VCWFIHFRVVLQKDTPQARGQIGPLPKGCAVCTSTFPVMTIPDGMCGCSYILGDGGGIISEAVSTLRHYLAQPPTKRVEVWWRWESGLAVPNPPVTECSIDLNDFLAQNTTQQLKPEIRYRITNPAKFAR
jgi:hypothetical protein